MADIVMGLPAIDRAQAFPAGYTILQLDNPSQYSGRITSIEVWFYTGTSNGFYVGTFYGSGTSYTCRSYCICGNVAAGSKRVIPVNIHVEVGDVIGIYYATGTLENYAGTGTQKYANANYFDASVHTYSEAAQSASLQAVGVTILINGLQTIPHDITKYSKNPVELINIVNRQRIGLTGTTYHNYIGV